MTIAENEILAQMKLIINKITGSEKGIDLNDHLLNDLGLDSLSFIELIVDIETQFNVRLPDDFIIQGDVQTVEGLCKVIDKLTSESSN